MEKRVHGSGALKASGGVDGGGRRRQERGEAEEPVSGDVDGDA